MSQLYLILHRVRGEPAWDVAIEAMYGTEQGWCIPTSGHRAFPVDFYVLDTDPPAIHETWSPQAIPEDWPDHYSVNDRPRKREKTLTIGGEELTIAEIEAVLAAVKELKGVMK